MGNENLYFQCSLSQASLFDMAADRLAKIEQSGKKFSTVVCNFLLFLQILKLNSENNLFGNHIISYILMGFWNRGKLLFIGIIIAIYTKERRV